MANRIVYQEFGSSQDALARPDSENFTQRSPQDQSPRIQASRKGRKGKTATVITGLQDQIETLESLLKQLKNQCGAGGTLKDGEIEIQGDHTQKILQILLKLGYKAKISGG
jgi:translation initiation factor 1